MNRNTTALYFNGGKEALIILHMFGHLSQIVWVPDPDDFPEITQFVIEVTKNLSVLKYSNFKESLLDLEHRGITTVITGVRRSDPGCESMTPYQAIDKAWAQSNLIRYSPLLDWSYTAVWNYLDKHGLKVCPLYERGYTSIGNRKNTFPNSKLFNGMGYLHARELNQFHHERMGRIKHELPIYFKSHVIRGYQRGRTLGFPTANLEVPIEMDEGVYYGYSWLRGNKYPMVLSNGLNCQFGTRSLEVHICETFDFEFYGEMIEVQVVGYIRKMEAFEMIEELIRKIDDDINIMKFNLNY